MFHTPALPDSSPHPTSEIGLNKMASNVTMQEEEDEEKVWDSDPYRLIDEHLDGDIFLSPSQEYHSYPYHLFLSIMLALFFRRRPYHGSLFLSLHFKEWLVNINDSILVLLKNTDYLTSSNRSRRFSI